MDEPLMIDGMEPALLGFSDVWHPDGSRVSRAIYSGPKIIEILQAGDIEDEDEAFEFFEYNIAGAYVGPSTPIIMWPKEDCFVADYVIQ